MKNEEHSKLLRDFVAWLTLKGYKPRGIEEKERAVRQYLEYVDSHGLAVGQIGIREAESYREHARLLMTDRGVSRYNPKTINRRIAYVRLFYRYLISIHRAHRNPFLDIDMMKESESVPKNIVSIEEMEKLLSAIAVKTPADFKFKVIIEVLYASGLRINELSTLKVEDARPGLGYVIVRDDKSRQDRTVPLTEYSSRLLKLYVRYACGESQTYLFAHDRKRGLNFWVNQRLKAITGELKLPRFTCHSIRHSMATHLLKKGADLREVQEILGHKRIRNTEVYTRIFPEDLKEVIERTHPRERIPV